MADTTLPDNHHVSRNCKPTTFDQYGLPLSAAFLPRQGEERFSVNWFEHFGGPASETAIDHVRTVFWEKGLRVARNDRFISLNVGAAKAAVHEGVGYSFVEEQAGALEQESAVVV